MSSSQIWTYRDATITQRNLAGLSVEAIDGKIGKIDQASHDVGSSHIVADTGPWIFGKKVLLPAGVINNIDTEGRTVYVDRTKEQIKDAPEYDPETAADPAYFDRVGKYYGETYRI